MNEALYGNVALYKGENLFRHWIGPKADGYSVEALAVNAKIERVFQAHNAIAEVVDNVVNGLISEQFVITLRGTDGEIDKSDRAEAAHKDLTRWLNWICEQATQVDPLISTLHKADPIAEFVTQVLVCGSAQLRVWQSERDRLNPDPIKRLRLHVPRLGSVKITYDDHGLIEKIEYIYGDGETEAHEYIDGRYQITDGEESVIVDSGRWRILTMAMESLITESVADKQNAICHELTMLVQSQTVSGFRERILLNAQPPGDDVTITRGPGILQYETGVTYRQGGEEKYAIPSVFESQPVAVENFERALNIWRSLLYLEFRQGHLLENGGDVSGESRVQQRQNFHNHLIGYATAFEGIIAGVLNVALEEFGYGELEAVVDLSITTGKLTADEQRIILEKVAAGLMSKSTAIGLLNDVSDVDAEIEAIALEREAMADMMEPALENTRADERPRDDQQQPTS